MPPRAQNGVASGGERSEGNEEGEAWLLWSRTRDAWDEEEEETWRERRRSRARLFDLQNRALLLCVDLVATVAANNALPNILLGGQRSCWKRERRQNNFAELFEERTTDEIFKRQLRMTKASFEKLLCFVESDLVSSRFARGDYLSPQRMLTLTLLRLAHGLTYLQLSQLFAIGISSAHKCFKRGVEAICKLKERFVRMPTTTGDIESCVASFTGRGFPNAFLAVDGCHIKVELTDQYHGMQDFICYKGFYSLNNVAYVDGNGMFRAVLCGWAGSSADGGVVKEMQFTKKLLEGFLTDMHGLYKSVGFLDQRGHFQTVQVPPVVLADSAFGLYTWQMTPYKGDNGSGTGPERRYNHVHSSARVVVEHSFGRLKGRFRLLLRTHRTSWKQGARTVMAAMVLHNFLGIEHDLFVDEWADGVEELQDVFDSGHGVASEYANVDCEPAMVLKEGLTRFFVQRGRGQQRERNR